MDKQVFESYRKLIYAESGIVLADEKISLLENRLRKILNVKGIADERDYLKIVETDLSGTELKTLIEAISTNTTHFYREERHFSILAKIITDYIKAGRKSIKIWCAAASSGEEPYTILFTLMENSMEAGLNWEFLATDINTKVLKKATEGVYPAQALNKITSERKAKFFTVLDSEGSAFQVKAEYRKHILFKKFNLIQFPYPFKENIDIIFCRNVMIYFDLHNRSRIITEFERLMAPGGYLFLSHSESLLGIETILKKTESSVFRKIK